MMPFDASAFDDGVIVAHGHGGVAGHPARVERKVVPNLFNGDFLRLRESANPYKHKKECK